VEFTFVLLREGTSDDGLVPHLQALLVRAGATTATGTSRPYRGSVQAKLEALRGEEDTPDLVFIHWDSDARSSAERREHVELVCSYMEPPPWCVPVVPVQELEAWLLVDEAAIRTAVGRPSGQELVSLPALRAIERTAGPKEILQAALAVASGTTGRKRRKEVERFPQRRRTLLERLDLDGPVSELPSFQRLIVTVQVPHGVAR